MKRPTPIIWLIHADLFLLDRVAQPAVNFCSRRWGWHFVKIGETICAMGLATYVALLSVFLLHHDPFATGIVLVIGAVFVALVMLIVQRAAQIAGTVRLGVGNPNRAALFNMRFWQWMSLAIAVEPPPSLLLAATAVLLGSGFYVLSCQPGPPKEQRVPSMAVTEVA